MHIVLREPSSGMSKGTTTTNKDGMRFWKRLGIAGFAFFLVKGMVWLVIPVVIYLMGTAG